MYVKEVCFAILFIGNHDRDCVGKCFILQRKKVGDVGMKEKELKLILEGISTVATMLKLIIQHRGQVRKEKKDV